MTPVSSSEPVGVVIVDQGIAEADVHQHLGDSLPLRIVSWQDQSYLATIVALRPQVIIIWGAPETLVHERSQLIASLFSVFAPTTISATIMSESGTPCLIVEQLGAGATVRIAELSDVLLP
jgi:hypothetical protein